MTPVCIEHCVYLWRLCAYTEKGALLYFFLYLERGSFDCFIGKGLTSHLDSLIHYIHFFKHEFNIRCVEINDWLIYYFTKNLSKNNKIYSKWFISALVKYNGLIGCTILLKLFFRTSLYMSNISLVLLFSPLWKGTSFICLV